MNSNKYFYLFSIIIFHITMVATVKTDPKLSLADLIVNPDAQHEKKTVKDQVEEIRKSIKNDQKLPIASEQQLNETSGMREKIHKAVKEDKYENGEDVPDDINVQLNARKDALLIEVGSTEDASIKGEVVEANSVPDAAVKVDPLETIIDDGNKKEKRVDPHDHKKRNKIFLRIPSITQVTIPILRKLKRGFFESLFASL